MCRSKPDFKMHLNSHEFFGDLLALCLLERYLFISLYVHLPTFKISLASINIVIKCSRTLTGGLILVGDRAGQGLICVPESSGSTQANTVNWGLS